MTVITIAMSLFLYLTYLTMVYTQESWTNLSGRTCPAAPVTSLGALPVSYTETRIEDLLDKGKWGRSDLFLVCLNTPLVPPFGLGYLALI